MSLLSTVFYRNLYTTLYSHWYRKMSNCSLRNCLYMSLYMMCNRYNIVRYSRNNHCSNQIS